MSAGVIYPLFENPKCYKANKPYQYVQKDCDVPETFGLVFGVTMLGWGVAETAFGPRRARGVSAIFGSLAVAMFGDAWSQCCRRRVGRKEAELNKDRTFEEVPCK
jgi:hypothetical protein